MIHERDYYSPIHVSPRTHDKCKREAGAFRPGKTAQDKARGVQRFHKNKRVYDRSKGEWVKI